MSAQRPSVSSQSSVRSNEHLVKEEEDASQNGRDGHEGDGHEGHESDGHKSHESDGHEGHESDGHKSHESDEHKSPEGDGHECQKSGGSDCKESKVVEESEKLIIRCLGTKALKLLREGILTYVIIVPCSKAFC